MTRCTGGETGCLGHERCLTHDLWTALGEQIETFLGGVSLKDVLDGVPVSKVSPPCPSAPPKPWRRARSDERRTYLDFNASAPLRPEAREAVLAALDLCGNPSSVRGGPAARAVVDEAREAVAALVNASPAEVVYPSGATEANTWALSAPWQHIAVSGIEHDSTCARLQLGLQAQRGARTIGSAGLGATEQRFTKPPPPPPPPPALDNGALVVLQLREQRDRRTAGRVQAAGLWAALRTARTSTPTLTVHQAVSPSISARSAPRP